jgi:hypothetical protein
MRRPFLLSTAALAGALTLALGCTDQPAPTGPAGAPAPRPNFDAQATLHFTSRRPLAFDVVSPCTGELVHFSGELFEQVTAVGPQELLDQGQALRFENQAVTSGTGTGAVTGTTYFIRDVLHFGINSPTLEALNFTLTFQETIHAITRGPGENFLIHVSIHVTVLPSGEIATTFEVVSAECRG